ncbi:MAG: pyridoxal-phosphate dependent enzyme [candidate division Zixibacteria bacterium]|nr:pyridoxal-phosphate dependent enzyme [candidate division Zixibacteria bacterium]
MDKIKTTRENNYSPQKVEKFWNDITEAVGRTPIVKLRKIPAERGIRATVLVKPEFMNPTGSVKDRMAVFVLNEAVRTGELKPGGTIIEATSGNTGAAIAMYAAAHGYRAILTIPAKMSKEKIDTLKAFGAEVYVCPTEAEPDSPEHYYQTALRLQGEIPNAYFMKQYFNNNNIESHYRTTGPEIWEQLGGQLDVFVGGIGTGGTVSGTGKYLKEKNSAIEIVAADPYGSIFFQYHKDGTLAKPHTYLVEGIGEDMPCDSIDYSVIDKIYQVSDRDSFRAARDLTRKEGIFAGGSGGAALHAALVHAEKLDADKTVLVILPDSGIKYISKIFNDDWMREKGFLD